MRVGAGNWLSIAAIGAMLAAPVLLGEFWTGFFARCTTWIYLAISFTIAYSFAGIPSLAQATIFAIGAYATVWLSPFLGGEILALAGSALVAGAIAASGLGVLVLRMSKNGAAIATIIVAVVGFVLGNSLVPVTGGANGLPLPERPFSFAGLAVAVGSTTDMLVIAVGLLVALLGGLWLLTRSHAWMVIRAIQENERRARVLGYSVDRYRLGVFTLSGAIAGMGGSLYALVSTHVTTDLLSLLMSFKAILWAVVGGIATVFGAPIGVLVVQVISELLSRWTLRVDLIIGVLLILTALVLPNGLLGLFRAKEEIGPATVEAGKAVHSSTNAKSGG